jgi:hypothetical protein
MCLDEKAALLLERQNQARIVLDSTQNKLVEVMDSAIQNRNQQIKALTGIVKGYESDNLSLQGQFVKAQQDCKKSKVKSFVVGAGAGSIFTLVLVLLL